MISIIFGYFTFQIMLFPYIGRNFGKISHRCPSFLSLSMRFSKFPQIKFPQQPRALFSQKPCRNSPSESPQNKVPHGPNGGSHQPPRTPFKGIAAFMAISTGISLAFVYYVSQMSKATEVSSKVLEDLLARGEVRSISVSQGREMALILLHSAQFVDGKPVYVWSQLLNCFH